VPGVRASPAVVPYYVRPAEAAIVAHFQAVAARSPVPLIVYNIPYRTARGLGSAALLELAHSENIGRREAGRRRHRLRHAEDLGRSARDIQRPRRRRRVPVAADPDGRRRRESPPRRTLPPTTTPR
jgi:hypothetical protein